MLENTYSTKAMNRHGSIHYLTSKGLLRSLVGTLRHAIQLQCHQIELLAIRDTKGPIYKCLLNTNQKNLIWDVLCLTSNWKVTAWRTWAQDCLYQRHTQYRWRSISRLEYDPSVNQTAESYFMTKVNKKSKAVRDKTGRQSQIQWCKLKVVTSKHEDLISCLQ